MEYLFSYGSNNPEQLATRLKKEKIDVVIPAYYPNHKLAFGSWSKNWLGGVATMVPISVIPQSNSSSQNNSNNSFINSNSNSSVNNNVSQKNSKLNSKLINKSKIKSKLKSKTKKSSKSSKSSNEDILNNLSIHENTFGYLTLLSKEDFIKLDVFEAVKYGKYTREKIEVTTNTGEKIIAHTYFLTPKAIDWVGFPSQPYLEAIYKTQSVFWSDKFKVIPIVKADDKQVFDEWTPDIYKLGTKISKLVKTRLLDRKDQLVTLGKLDILGLLDLNSLKKKYNKESKKISIDMNLEIINRGYLPFKTNIQNDIEKLLS
jgi:hypothetical protein